MKRKPKRDHRFDWVNLGTTSGADEDYVALSVTARNYGPFGYTLPEVGTTYSLVYDYGIPGSRPWPVLRGVMERIASALRKTFPRLVWIPEEIGTLEIQCSLDRREEL